MQVRLYTRHSKHSADAMVLIAHAWVFILLTQWYYNMQTKLFSHQYINIAR
jgi:hypothetical protein